MQIIRKLTSREQMRLQNFLMYFIGIAFMPAGVVMTINSDLGAGGYDALNFALGNTLGIKTSYAIYMTAIIAVLVTALIRRGIPRISTFISSFFLGISTDFWKEVLAFVKAENLIESIVILCAGIVIVGFSVASYMLSKFPTNPTDDFVLALKEKNVPIKGAKIGFDILCVILAWILGGSIGLGTILVTAGLGPVIDKFYCVLEKSFTSI